VHTLHVLENQKEITDACFAIRGANLNLDDKGNVETVLDAAAALEIYLAQCRQAGHPRPDVIGA
jgi:citrate lyase gamma subunit